MEVVGEKEGKGREMERAGEERLTRERRTG
jgi:hypothetical protein